MSNLVNDEDGMEDGEDEKPFAKMQRCKRKVLNQYRRGIEKVHGLPSPILL